MQKRADRSCSSVVLPHIRGRSILNVSVRSPSSVGAKCHGRHRSYRGTRRCGAASVAYPALRIRDDDDAQDIARAEGRVDPVSSEEFAKDVDRSVFPGVQGGPLIHVIAAKAVAFRRGTASRDSRAYQQQIVTITQRLLADSLTAAGLRLVSGGTDNHLLLVDVYMDGKGITGKDAEKALESRRISP
jgi:hypothetical protein